MKNQFVAFVWAKIDRADGAWLGNIERLRKKNSGN
jgi:hypothetical protein